MRRVPIVAALLVAMLAVQPVWADDHEDDDWDDDHSGSGYELNDDGPGFEYEVEEEWEANGTDFEEEFEVSFDADDGELSISFEREEEREQGEEEWETEIEDEMDVEFIAIVEFVDEDGDGAFTRMDTALGHWCIAGHAEDDDADEVCGQDLEDEDEVASWDLAAHRGKIAWAPFTYAATQDGNGPGHRFAGSGTFDDGASTFGLTFKIHENTSAEAGTTVGDRQVKFDIWFDVANSTYTNASSQLAVIHVVETAHETEHESERDDDDEDVETDDPADQEGRVGSAENASMEYRWRNNATVDGNQLSPVGSNVTDLDDDDDEWEKLITFAYERGSSILHDPVAGAQTTDNVLLARLLSLLPGVLSL